MGEPWRSQDPPSAPVYYPPAYLKPLVESRLRARCRVRHNHERSREKCLPSRSRRDRADSDSEKGARRQETTSAEGRNDAGKGDRWGPCRCRSGPPEGLTEGQDQAELSPGGEACAVSQQHALGPQGQDTQGSLRAVSGRRVWNTGNGRGRQTPRGGQLAGRA